MLLIFFGPSYIILLTCIKSHIISSNYYILFEQINQALEQEFIKMPFISVSEEVAKKSFTSVENKFITKYLPVLEPVAIKVYLYSLYLYQNGQTAFTLSDLAASLRLTEDEAKGYFEYLEELELVSIISEIPFEIKILDAENLSGTPKKFKAEKYGDFAKSVQNIIKGRMISPNEFREYFFLIEEYGFEQNALVMIINYCTNLKGDDIRLAYIKKVAKTFASEGVTTAKKVEEKLSAYTSSTPALIKLFSAAGIKKQPDIDDDKYYKKWTEEMGFEEEAIVAAAKLFKAKTVERIDCALDELYKNKKFDVKEIADYCNTKSSIYSLALEVAKNLGVYVQNPAPYVENYVSVWCNYGYSHDSLKNISVYCFMQGKNSFDGMNTLIQGLYNEGIVADISVDGYIKDRAAEDKLLKEILSACGLTRKIIDWDRQSLSRWREWKFDDAMLFEAAKLSSGKSNPLAYMNGILSAWKADNVYAPDKINRYGQARPADAFKPEKAEIERHYFDLRRAAEERAEKTLARAMSDEVYGRIHREINSLSIRLAFEEIKDKDKAAELAGRISELEIAADKRLKELKINKEDFKPHYKCKICNDTGYDGNGNPCKCMEEFLKTLN